MSFVPEPLSLPFSLTLGAIPLTYLLGHISGNVSWVDRAWPFWPVLCSTLVVVWTLQQSQTGYQAALPRLWCMLGLQYVWSARLTTNAIRRDFYDLKSEDYRYTQFRKLVPGWLFQLVHLFVIATAQPLLLFGLAIPLHTTLRLSATPQSTALNIWDGVLILTGLLFVFIEYTADNQMYAYQTAKYASKTTDRVVPPIRKSTVGPEPASYPRFFHPGFITTGLFAWTRHPNFAAEQLFWVNQALFALNAGLSSDTPRERWVSFWPTFGPSFALSLLFCSSTFLTEWITGKKYPAYKAYKGLVGQFLPQETLLVRLWSFLTGRTGRYRQEIETAPPTK